MDPMKESLRQIWDGPCSCSRCHQRLTPLAFSCHGGHMFCPDCKIPLNKCPICSKAFNIEAPAAFNRVLQLLPKCCRYMDCSEIIDSYTRLKEHETWCGHRPTQCKFCRWSDQAKELYNHFSQKHFDYIFETDDMLEFIPYPPNHDGSICLVKKYGQIFWVTYGIDRASADVYVRIVWVPDGSVNRNLFKAEVSFQVGSCKISVTIPIIHQHPTNASESNHLKVPLSELMSSRDMDGTYVRFNLAIVKI